MNIHKHKWILLFLIMWLPLQGAVAAILSVCSQEKAIINHQDQIVMTADHHHENCHKQSTNSLTDHLIASFSCDAYSHTPMVSNYTALIATNSTSAITSLHSDFTSFGGFNRSLQH